MSYTLCLFKTIPVVDFRNTIQFCTSNCSCCMA